MGMTRFGLTRNDLILTIFLIVLILILGSAILYRVSGEEVQAGDYRMLSAIMENPKAPESVKDLVLSSMEDNKVTVTEYSRIMKGFRQTRQVEEASQHVQSVRNLRKLLDEQTTN